MLNFILFLHARNVYLVILAGAVTGIWGLILFARTKTLVPDASKTKASDAPATTTSTTKAEDVPTATTTSTTEATEASDAPAPATSQPDSSESDTPAAATDDGEAKDAPAVVLTHDLSAFKARTKTWRIALTITVVLGLLQGVFGVIMVILGQKPGPAGDSLYYLHFVYGGIVALVIPVATSYATGGKNPRRDLLVYSLAALILTAAAVRAWMTGPAVFTLLP